MANHNMLKPGDGHMLPDYHWWQLFSRSLFHLHLADGTGARETWSVDVRLGGDDDGEVHAQLYRNGLRRATAKLPAVFPVPGGRIEVAAGPYGLKRNHYVMPDGSQRQLVPDPASAEGLRTRLERNNPALSRAIGIVSAGILVAALVIGMPQVLEQITQVPPIAESIGTFSSPFDVPAAANYALLVATLAASTERALRLRYNWLLDGGFLGGGE